jgi:hypothetical protein
VARRKDAARPHTFRYRGLTIKVEPDEEPGFYRFGFRLAGKSVHGRTQTRLLGIAVKRARDAANRHLKGSGENLK